MRDFSDIEQQDGVLLATTMNVVCCENCDMVHFFMIDKELSSFAVANFDAHAIPAIIARLQKIDAELAARRKAGLS